MAPSRSARAPSCAPWCSWRRTGCSARGSTRPASRRRSRSSRIRSIAACSSSSSRRGASASCATERCCPPTSSTCAASSFPAASGACSAWRLPRTRRAAASSSTSRTDPATRSSRASGARPIRSSPTRHRVSICAWAAPAARPSSRSRSANHNGGHLAFGPDGYLYIGLGDGGSGNDPDHRAQNPQELLGKMLRIDVNVPDTHAIGYQVPPDNPFVGGRPVAARPEIWASACAIRGATASTIRRAAAPARSSSATSARARGKRSTTSRASRGGRNYGWRNREGAHDNVTSRPPAFLPLVDPIHEYDRSSGQSVTGGYVYRGRALGSAYRGRYFFADFVQGRVWSIALTIDGQGEARASGLTRAHRGARRPESARQHQLVRRRRRRRAVHRQPDAGGRAERCRPRPADADRVCASFGSSPAPFRRVSRPPSVVRCPRASDRGARRAAQEKQLALRSRRAQRSRLVDSEAFVKWCSWRTVA